MTSNEIQLLANSLDSLNSRLEILTIYGEIIAGSVQRIEALLGSGNQEEAVPDRQPPGVG
ncbi:MAG TPA: hypothetical protein GXZ59_03470 [Clostridiaceae bacterium]|jgi:hypothetical protein|nr:hypothetical protein [Clostridiaceae bacterium]